MEGAFVAILFLAYLFGGGVAGVYLTLWVLVALSVVLVIIAALSLNLVSIGSYRGGGDTAFINLIGSVVALVVMWVAYFLTMELDGGDTILNLYILR
ncbi:MAG: hypothetical protein HY457_03445 [Parcubacteria group bacterium]|nr:hypothetical protein [Parcubacteria group bacterium]